MNQLRLFSSVRSFFSGNFQAIFTRFSCCRFFVLEVQKSSPFHWWFESKEASMKALIEGKSIFFIKVGCGEWACVVVSEHWAWDMRRLSSPFTRVAWNTYIISQRKPSISTPIARNESGIISWWSSWFREFATVITLWLYTLSTRDLTRRRRQRRHYLRISISMRKRASSQQVEIIVIVECLWIRNDWFTTS